MNIAIVGSGISGLATAWLLSREHNVTVFEAGDRIGGHTATVDVQLEGRHYAIDTGFIVYNDRTYPNFIRLLDELGVENQPTEMSFSVSCANTGLEYAGSNLDTLFAQRSNLLNPRFLRMLLDIVRFNRQATRDLAEGNLPDNTTLGDYLALKGYSPRFASHYLVPMGAAIWSSGTEGMQDFPLRFFVRFFHNHGLLALANRPQWRVIKGGSRNYLPALTAPYLSNIRVSTPVKKIIRHSDNVSIELNDGSQEQFDQVVLATHSDQALAMLADASELEQDILGALPYQDNDVVLHTDTSLLPENQRTWSSWNYRLDGNSHDRAKLTYNMNILQGISSPHTFCVTLNDNESIDESKILRRFNYSHPVFTLEGIAAQQRWSEINGSARTWFCGAYWANGFHEDGLTSAIRVARGLGVNW